MKTSELRARYLASLRIPVYVERQHSVEHLPVVVESSAQAAVVSPSAPEVVTPVAPAVKLDVNVVRELDWVGLQKQVAGCTACALHKTRSQTVFGMGHTQPRLVIIGEGPGANEDRLGLPFVGRAGQLLDAMLKAIRLQRDEVFITNIVKCRPPNNRDPLPEEVASCSAYLERQLQLLQPQLILALGKVAAHYLLKTDLTIAKLRGQVQSLPGKGLPVIVTYHPAYLLRSPSDKAKAWQDLQMTDQWLYEHAPSSTRI